VRVISSDTAESMMLKEIRPERADYRKTAFGQSRIFTYQPLNEG